MRKTLCSIRREQTQQIRAVIMALLHQLANQVDIPIMGLSELIIRDRNGPQRRLDLRAQHVAFSLIHASLLGRFH
jgi:hypothetical protein